MVSTTVQPTIARDRLSEARKHLIIQHGYFEHIQSPLAPLIDSATRCLETASRIAENTVQTHSSYPAHLQRATQLAVELVALALAIDSENPKAYLCYEAHLKFLEGLRLLQTPKANERETAGDMSADIAA